MNSPGVIYWWGTPMGYVDVSARDSLCRNSLMRMIFDSDPSLKYAASRRAHARHTRTHRPSGDGPGPEARAAGPRSRQSSIDGIGVYTTLGLTEATNFVSVRR